MLRHVYRGGSLGSSYSGSCHPNQATDQIRLQSLEIAKEVGSNEDGMSKKHTKVQKNTVAVLARAQM